MKIELKIFTDNENDITEGLLANHISKLLIDDSLELEMSLKEIVNSTAVKLVNGVQKIMSDKKLSDYDRVEEIFHLFMRNNVQCDIFHEGY